jgi:hypothetical protein
MGFASGTLSIGIVGAGIAGLVLAIRLHGLGFRPLASLGDHVDLLTGFAFRSGGYSEASGAEGHGSGPQSETATG